MSERAAIAHHESGHAVCAELLELPTRSVSIVPNPQSGGRSLLTTTIGHLSVARVVTWMLAGPAAERLYRRGAARHGTEDIAFVRELLTATKRGDEDVDTLEHRYEALANAQVLLHQSWITRVADALLARYTLTAHEVRRLRPKEDRG